MMLPSMMMGVGKHLKSNDGGVVTVLGEKGKLGHSGSEQPRIGT